jgi:hypothetical protein
VRVAGLRAPHSSTFGEDNGRPVPITSPPVKTGGRRC